MKTASRAELLNELKRIAAKSGRPEKFETARLFIEGIFDARTPSHALNFMAAAEATARAVNAVPGAELEAYLAMWERAHAILKKMGYRENVFTFQEHKLMGSSFPGLAIIDPYVPMGILDQGLTLSEARKARRLVAWMNVTSDFFLSEDILVPVALEPLGKDGRTVRDPRRVDIPLFDSMLREHPFSISLELSVLTSETSPDFPFRRD